MGFSGGPRVPKLVVEPTPLKNMWSRQFGSSLQVSGENNQRFETTNQICIIQVLVGGFNPLEKYYIVKIGIFPK